METPPLWESGIYVIHSSTEVHLKAMNALILVVAWYLEPMNNIDDRNVSICNPFQ